MNMRRLAILAITLCALVAACGGGGSGNTPAARDLKDPRSVPQASVPATLPSPIPALDLSKVEPAKPTQLPDTYVVKSGDTPSSIARDLGVDAQELLRLNNITDPTALKVGQQLRIPRPQPSPTATRPGATGTPGRTPTATGTPGRSPTPGGTAAAPRTATATATTTATATATPASGTGGTYIVKSGDTGCAIATALGVPLSALAAANGLTVSGLASLQVGQQLKIPTTGGPPGC
jgi:LysM repeat protein